MAKEIVDVPIVPKVTMSNGVALRRHSAGIASSGNNEKKVVVPHYLRASTGSCHDFCKYGRRSVEEARQKLSKIKKDGRKSLSRSSEDSSGGIMISVANPRASTDSNPTKKMELSAKSSGGQKQIGNKVLVNTNKVSSVRVKPSFLPKSHVSSIPETRRGRISSSFEVEIPSKPTSKSVETSPTAISVRVKTHPKSTSQMVKTSSESMSKMKQTSSKVSSFEDKEMELSEKHVTSLNPNSITMQTISSMNSPKGLGGQRNSKIKMKKREASSKSSCREIGSVSARKHKGLKIVPHLVNQPKPIKDELEEHNNEAQEKILYVIKMETANQTSQSDQNESQDIELPLPNSLSPFSISKSSSQEESEYPTSEFEEDASSGNHEIENTDKVDNLDAEENRMTQKEGIVCSEDNDCQKQRRNLAETQIEEDSVRSLKFRRGEVLEENDTDVKTSAITSSEKVVLRHQDVQVKKDGRGLYNTMIKETASKLVEVRKSKVKALVDAFETVISLEEKKTSANYVN